MLDTWITFVKVNCSILAWILVFIIALYLFYFMASAVKESLSDKEEKLNEEAYKKFFFDEIFCVPSLTEEEEEVLYKAVMEAGERKFKLMVESVCGLGAYKAIMSDNSIKDKKEWFIEYIKEIREERGMTDRIHDAI